jgi:hypothetical protein
VVRIVALLTCALLPILSGVLAVSTTGSCSDVSRAAGLCVDASVGDQSVDLSGSSVTPGNNPSLGSTAPDVYSDPTDSDQSRVDPTLSIPRAGDRAICAVTVDFNSIPICRTTTADPAPASDATPAVTLTDISTFRPTPGTDHMQPDGWTVAGLDTNFYAAASPQVVPGTLLGRPAEVRFTPVGFHWDYGDGTAADRSTPGGTWDQLHVAEFDPTPTSHVYAALGDYTIRLRIDYRAEYRFDGPAFVPIAGTITLPANDLRVTVGDAKTVLVNRDCAVDPGGPGC